MSKINIINPSENAIEMMIQIDIIPATVEYDIVKSTISSMYYTSAHVL